MSVRQSLNKGQLRVQWGNVLLSSDWETAPGIRHLHGKTADVFEWRDGDGLLHGVVTLYQHPDRSAELFLMTDPAWRRRGIATQLLTEATKHFTIDFEHQSYTRDGARTINAFLRRSSPIMRVIGQQQHRRRQNDHHKSQCEALDYKSRRVLR